jgi:hypothetical protein
MRARTLWPVLAALLGAAGCLTETTLQPLSTPSNPKGAAVAEANGVRLVAYGSAWHGNPSDLEHVITPVGVRLENQSGRPLRIDPQDFVLVGGSRFEYTALSPKEMHEEGLAVGGSGYSGGNVALSFGVGVGYPGWGWGPFPSTYLWHGAPWSWGPGWGGPGWASPYFGMGWYGYGYDPLYAPYYAYRPPEPLPTQDMVRKALPEGTLDNGGALEGFLYFQNVGHREGQVTLQARLVDARTGEHFATLSIPFGVHS